MGADSGTIVVLEDTRFYNIRVLKLAWQTGAGVATFEKTLTSLQAPRIAGQILMIAHMPGSTPPTAASDLAVFLADADSSQAAGVITAAADGLDLISTAYTRKVIALPQPAVLGALR